MNQILKSTIEINYLFAAIVIDVKNHLQLQQFYFIA
jgi:hypothetical protein